MDKALAVLMSLAAGLGIVQGRVNVPENKVEGVQTERMITDNGENVEFMKLGGSSGKPSGPTGKLNGISNAIEKLERNWERKFGTSGPTGSTAAVEPTVSASGPTGPTGEKRDRSEAVNTRSGHFMPVTIPTMAVGYSKALDIPGPSTTSFPMPPGRERNR